MKRILILEDDPDIGDIVEMALSPQYITLLRKNDTDLLEHFSSFKPDLLLIDNSIGQFQASVIINEIQGAENYEPIPFILFSGHEDIKALAQQIGATAYLQKPFKLAQLRQCIEDVLI